MTYYQLTFPNGETVTTFSMARVLMAVRIHGAVVVAHPPMADDACDYCGISGCHWSRHSEACADVRAAGRPFSDERSWSPVGAA